MYSKVIQLYVYIFVCYYKYVYSSFTFSSIIGYYKILSVLPCAMQ